MSTGSIAEQEYSKKVLKWIPEIFKNVIVEEGETFVVGEYQGYLEVPYGVEIPEEKKNFYGPLLSNPPEEMKELISNPTSLISNGRGGGYFSSGINLGYMDNHDKAIGILIVECEAYKMKPFAKRLVADIKGKGRPNDANECAKKIKEYFSKKYQNKFSKEQPTIEDYKRFTITYGVLTGVLKPEEAQTIANGKINKNSDAYSEMIGIIRDAASDEVRSKKLLFEIAGLQNSIR
jgi:hypothetical protein